MSNHRGTTMSGNYKWTPPLLHSLDRFNLAKDRKQTPKWDFSFNLSFHIPPYFSVTCSLLTPVKAAKVLPLLSFALECTSQRYLMRVWSTAARLRFRVLCSHKSPAKRSQCARALSREEQAANTGAGTLPHSLRSQLFPRMFGAHLIQQTQNTFTTKDKVRRIWWISAALKWLQQNKHDDDAD